jgi:hypothetical protein
MSTIPIKHNIKKNNCIFSADILPKVALYTFWVSLGCFWLFHDIRKTIFALAIIVLLAVVDKKMGA